MSFKTIDLMCIQLARMLFLVKAIKILPVAGTRNWAILVEGRGFSRLLKHDPLIAPNLIQGHGWDLPRPRTFESSATARRYLKNVGLGKLL